MPILVLEKYWTIEFDGNQTLYLVTGLGNGFDNKYIRKVLRRKNRNENTRKEIEKRFLGFTISETAPVGQKKMGTFSFK